ncbi:MAG: transcriptional regulator [Cytophagaceae bacterium]|nr:transcriptional regulator [Cytophagaceae bacterium]
MNTYKIYSFSGVAILLWFIWLLPVTDTSTTQLDRRAKVSLRSVGNELLLQQMDSTSLILPVTRVAQGHYELRFENTLAITPQDLVDAVDTHFQKANLPAAYSVSVVQCHDQEVAYSFLKRIPDENSLIPCLGRPLRQSCYTIAVAFTEPPKLQTPQQTPLYVLVLGIFLLIEVVLPKQKQPPHALSKYKGITIGLFEFIPEQLKLISSTKEVVLSKKECELLYIFSQKPNEIITRDELTKKVWEDHGVFVGRSLDTYISKLRKLIKEDPNLKITNIHGVGYSLEITS